jgi:photosystem II stability/assembly factor-like uncharacterized protein
MNTLRKFNFFLIFQISLFVTSYTSAQNNSQWEVLNEGREIKDVDFVNEKSGWMIRNEKLYRTEDGGETWTLVPLVEEWNIRLIEFLNENLGFILFNSGLNSKSYITKSVDGGDSWDVAHELPLELGWRPSITILNDSVMFITDDEDSIQAYKSLNGGQNWQEITPEYDVCSFGSWWFFNKDTMIITAETCDNKNYIFRTVDGGTNWSSKIVKLEIDDLQFLNDSTGYFLSRDEDLRSLLYVTTDTLNSWRLIYTTQIDERIHTYSFLSADTVFSILDRETDDIMISTDAGETWEKVQSMGNIASLWYQFYFTGDKTGLILADLCCIEADYNVAFKSKGTGTNWQIFLLDYHFESTFFIDKHIGFATGGDHELHGGFGNVFKTTDGGRSWEINLSSNGIIIKCQFVNDNTGYVLGQYHPWGNGSGGDIYKTNDGGMNWIPIYSGVDTTGFHFSGKDMSFLNPDTGIVVGSYEDHTGSGAGILATADAGENWDLIWRHPDDGNKSHILNAIHAVNSNAWAVGEQGHILILAGLDSVRNIQSNTDLPLNDVFFSDTHHGWISGGYYNDMNDYRFIFLKTKNGGTVWEEISNFKYMINDMFFEDSLHGWAAGYDLDENGIILETFDGGDNWEVQIGELFAPLQSLHFNDGYGWAVGKNGLILRTEDGINWIDQKRGKTFPGKFNLAQNYPNPFNPTTIINYELPITNYVELSIYNTLGQKVAILVSQRQDAGYYKVQWDARGLASGVYYYKIKAGEFRDVKKMILLR